MLRALDIRNMLIIDHLELAFQPGLNVLTGETGAGKSILLDSLGFVLGWRGRAELVRAGADQGEVVAEFALGPNHAAHAILQEAGLPDEDDTLILRRVNTRDGRKTAWVNDRRCSGEVLRALSETLVELHGQHDDRGLLNTRGHRTLLDSFAGSAALLVNVRTAWRAHAAAQTALNKAEALLAETRAEEEYLRHAAAELEALDPQPGEDDTLDTRRRMMQGAERIREDVTKGLEAIGLNGAEGRMSDAMRWLDGARDKAEGALDAALDALGRAQVELGEAQAGVEACLDQLSFDPFELETVEERLFALRALARKHDVSPEELPALAANLRAKLDALDASEGDIAALRRAVTDTGADYDAAAMTLSDLRAKAAKRLDAAMAAELAPLKMERAVFVTRLTEAPKGPEGIDAIAFEVATNPGAPAGPLNKIASGGELSRFLLALKVCLAGDDLSTTMIFDEIDRGVGGATADAVGRRLKALADGGQVLVVTHSPQVAALGAHHWQVAKRVVDEATLSSVTPLGDDARLDEIARMLAGDTITEAARAAAQALLDAAQ
ncbi:DNA recombination protein RecN [Thalassobacter stenotrophicus]|uniref:DNA repair protein RecN n=1 Tax=Thalassobacter TaxID=266808 RepID=UPI00051D3C5B|nr:MULTISPECIES: DNA repair protein RecN [Thalassobacter]KGK79140.1 DNA recombination protein RecN [Thalassobacter stenotrophicus]KGL03041.1 DNA recombination protein RecN [Thalassobacter sp. 16PALIMAR09]